MNPPSKLYKYQSCKDHTFTNLQQKQIWFSKPGNLNDPFDCDINFTIKDVTEENLTSLFDFYRDSAPNKNTFDLKYTFGEKFNDKFREDVISFAIEATNKVKGKQWTEIGVACFSEESDNILMWSHYADDHQGFCLEFDTNFAPFKSVNKKTLLKVNYPETNLYPSLSIKDIPNNLPSLVETQLGIKSSYWHYENEWRIFAQEGSKSYSFEKAALTGIYYGCRMKDDDKAIIKTILVNSPTTLYQMERSKTEFRVVAREIFKPTLTD